MMQLQPAQQSLLITGLQLASQFGEVSHAALILRDSPQGKLDTYATTAVPQEYLDFAARALSRRELTIIRSSNEMLKTYGMVISRALLPIVCLPVTAGGSPRGVVLAQVANPALEMPGLKFLQYLAELMGELLQDIALGEELQQKEEQVQNLVRATFDAQEAERERICLEVHVGIKLNELRYHSHLFSLLSYLGFFRLP